MVDWTSAKQFHDEPGTAGWRVLYRGAQTVFPTGSFATGVEFIRRIATDTELVRRVSVIAGDLGLAPDPSRLHTIQIAIAEAEEVPTRDFWIAALGYESIGRLLAAGGEVPVGLAYPR